MKGAEYTPTTDGWFDPISLDLDPAIGTDAEYATLVAVATERRGSVAGDLVPLHTGLGPDFHLALRRHADYPGMYTMVEIPKNADPARGRFRGYLATALRHLVADHFRRRRPVGVNWQANPHLHPPAPPADDDLDAAFVREWRQELLNAAWRELERDGDGQFYAVLRWRAAHPDTPSAALADELGVTAAGVRQTLKRARFAELLDGEVARSLGGAEPEAVERELEALGLRAYCRPGERRA